MTGGLLSPVIAIAARDALPMLRQSPEAFGLKLGTAIGSALPSIGGGMADYPAVVTALREAASLLEDAHRGASGVPQAYGLG